MDICLFQVLGKIYQSNSWTVLVWFGKFFFIFQIMMARLPYSQFFHSIYRANTTDKIFITGLNMEEYLAFNENTETWRCLMCQKEFSHKTSATRHLRIVHCANDRQQCHLCFVWFKNKVCLNQHVRVAHRRGLNKYPNSYEQQNS